jgi:hypothetical protein
MDREARFYARHPGFARAAHRVAMVTMFRRAQRRYELIETQARKRS